MEETGTPSKEAISATQELFLLAAVRALMETHPDAAAFRESWAHCLGLTMRKMLSAPPEYREDLNAAYRTLLPVWESYFPDSPAAQSRPGFGDTGDS